MRQSCLCQRPFPPHPHHLLQALPKILSFPGPAFTTSKTRQKEIHLPKHISHVFSKEKLNDVMASASDPVIASHCVWFPSAYKALCSLLPAPHSTLFNHAVRLLCSGPAESPCRFFFYRKKTLVKTRRQQYRLAPEIPCV